MAEARKTGKKNRKFNRKKKKPAQVRYTHERRWEKNKKRKAQKRAKRLGIVVKIKINGEWLSISPK